SKYPISALLSIPIARYYSLKRLALEHLLSLIIDHYFNSIGITQHLQRIYQHIYK
ncbi:MAG: hypothetical protein ACI9LM_001120, partial [Alteromonadaceae bacterium]